MRVRTLEIRFLGAALVVLWLVTFGLVLLGYRPGGPVDILVGIAAIGPLLVALAGLWSPPVARSDRAFAVVCWLAIGAMLLLVPSLGSLVGQLQGNGPQTLLPSLEAAYPWLLALIATGLFAGLGVARGRLGARARRRRRLLLGVAIGLLMTLAAGSVFAAAAIVNELALGDRPAMASRFGPTDPDLEPPPCTGLVTAGLTARLELRMDTSIDGRYAGQVIIEGIRDGRDVQWTGFAATRLALGQFGLIRVSGQVWDLAPGRGWAPVEARSGDGGDLDRQLVLTALTPANRNVAEDRGLAFIEGARARHCRVAVDGATVRTAVPQVRLLVGGTDISRWRGDLDFWVFADGQVGQADGRLTGPATGLGDDGLTAGIRFHLLAIDRGLPITVFAPAR
ncbi:MAG: hypothetical protein WCK58_12870 [Chloroflexota bacterium]